jgi:hypothetical protein
MTLKRTWFKLNQTRFSIIDSEHVHRARLSA